MDAKNIGLDKQHETMADEHEAAQLNHNKGILALWSLFFKSFEWLEKACQDGKPPILVTSDFNDILRDGVSLHRPAHVALLCQGAPSSLFKDCLQPHDMHFHKCLQYDYAFESHNVTLNASSVMTGSLANGIYTRWPERLSVATGRKRRSTYLVWGEDTIRTTESITGLGQNLEPDESVSSICHIDLHIPQWKGALRAIFHRHPLLLYKHDSSRSCYKYANDYEEGYRKHIIKGLYLSGPTLRKCEACIMKGYETPDMI